MKSLKYKFTPANSRENLVKLDEICISGYNDAEENYLGDGGICYAVPVLSKEL